MALRPILIFAALIIITVPLMLVQQALNVLKLKSARHLPQTYLALLCKIMGVRVEVVGKIPDQGAALLVGNHISWLDIPIVGSLFPTSFIAKKEIGSWPIISHLAKLQGTVFVDRIKRHTVLKSRNLMQNKLKQGHCLVLFPEGTSHTGKAVLPFKSSFFSAVAGLNVPVIPFTLVFSRLHGLPITARQRPLHAWYGDMELGPHVWQALLAGPVQVKVIFHEPLLPDHRKAMAKQAQHVIQRSLSETLHPAPKIS
jgi:lyso-ornithine lipid O-acyltransferase